MNEAPEKSRENRVLTAQEVADMLKITRNTVYELIRRGELNAYRAGRKMRLDLSDVDAYKRRSMSRKEDDPRMAERQDGRVDEKQEARADLQPSVPAWSGPSSFKPVVLDRPSTDKPGHGQNRDQIVLCGQDLILDVLARHLQMHPAGATALRSFTGSYNGLVALYRNEVQATTVHLWDGDGDLYNIPYVRRLLPGIPAVIIHLARRLQGFYVAEGNPKGITGWRDLQREDIVLINREKGSGTRILLDERLRLLGVSARSIRGYDRESTSHLAVASTVARGGADIGIGCEKTAQQVRGISFVPLQEECLELVVRRDDLDASPFRTLLEILRSEDFRNELEGIGGYNLTDLGRIVAET